jgi:hypothetical protein
LAEVQPYVRTYDGTEHGIAGRVLRVVAVRRKIDDDNES